MAVFKYKVKIYNLVSAEMICVLKKGTPLCFKLVCISGFSDKNAPNYLPTAAALVGYLNPRN